MRTCLFDEHVRLNARIVDFHGWDMPVWYSSIKEEHMATRTACGIFDVSHMGEIYLSGKDSAKFLNRVLTIDTSSMDRFQVKYAFMLNDEGGIIDDLTVYCIEPEYSYMLCVNASNTPGDHKWLEDHAKKPGIIDNRSQDVAMIAIQGPESGKYLKECLNFELGSVRYYRFAMYQTKDLGELMISRTGYTGADGVEVFMDADLAAELWRKLLDLGATPCGLGARDTLRLEMGYPLHGNDIDEKRSPLEAGLMFAVDMGKDFFIGKNALERQESSGIQERLMGLILNKRGIPRQGYPCIKDGKVVGRITSGNISPVLNKGIALGYLDSSIDYGDHIYIEIRSKKLESIVKKPPFVKGQIHK